MIQNSSNKIKSKFLIYTRVLKLEPCKKVLKSRLTLSSLSAAVSDGASGLASLIRFSLFIFGKSISAACVISAAGSSGALGASFDTASLKN